jgi:hypothetical protein
LRKLDPTPTFEEELRDFEFEEAYAGTEPYDPDAARMRIDKIARRLALVWSIFLIYIILAQGLPRGWRVRVESHEFWIIPIFKLETAEFVAVVTTTTAAVFGFLVIVSRHLFQSNNNQ